MRTTLASAKGGPRSSRLQAPVYFRGLDSTSEGADPKRTLVSRKAESRNDHQASRWRHIYGFGAVIALALMLVAITVNALHAGHRQKKAEGWQMHTMQVLLVAERLRSAANEALRGERGYLITGDPNFLEPYENGSRTAPGVARRLRELTQDNPGQHPMTSSLDVQLKRYLDVIGQTVALARQGKTAEAVASVKTGAGRREIEALTSVINRIEAEERRLLTEREAANAYAAKASELADYALAALALVFLLIVAWAGLRASQARMDTLRMEEKLRHAATTDELTGLLNRRAFLAALDVEILRSARSGSPLALALVDLDHFKSVNDRFGHAGGDEVLRRFAETARGAMRTSDIIGRLGGEEFAVLMPETDQVQSGIAGERLRDTIARRRVVLSTGALCPVTISVGVAHYKPGEKRDRLIIRADEALYDAKDSGRNRTRLAA
ncbi:MAG: diguanylate cyclase [Sphingomonadales bacterium]|nr:MAG: diguanylate cyclase [Sphingomonadales bacterium]